MAYLKCIKHVNLIDYRQVFLQFEEAGLDNRTAMKRREEINNQGPQSVAQSSACSATLARW
jgi:hypothetical protein